MSDPDDTVRAGKESTAVLDRTAEVLSDAGFGEVRVLSHEAADRVLTPNRRELIRTIDTEDVQSIRDLARRVGRDEGNVARDLNLLAAERIVSYRQNGQAKQPYIKPDTIVQQPVVTTSDA